MQDPQQPRALVQFGQLALDMGAKILAFSAAICIALSVLFDWGYLSALNLRLSEVPTSLSDHTRSAILWLPLTGIIFPFAVVFVLFMGRLEANAILAVRNGREDTKQNSAKVAKDARWKLALLVIFLIALWFAFGDRARPYLFFVAATAWALVVANVTPKPFTDGSLSIKSYLRLALTLPLILAGALFSAGYNTGRAAAAPNQPLGTMVVRGAAGGEQIVGNIVRPFERFVIVLDARNKIILLKPEDILRVERVGYVSSNTGLLCKFWQVACP